MLLTGLACGDEDPVQVPADPVGAQALVQQADQELENQLFEDLNSNPDHPTDLDFSKAHDLYQQALALDADNLDARFGVSVTGMLILTSDPEVIAAFDEWEAYLNASGPFEIPKTTSSPLGVPIGFARGGGSLRMPFDVVQIAVLAQSRMMLTLTDPQVSRAQAILRERVLPKLAATIDHLGTVAQNPHYTYTVTPRMQGDTGASPAEIDRTDILAVRAGASLLSAVCRVLVSYELSMASYDSTSLYNALQPGSSWLSLLPDGQSHMEQVPIDLTRAADDVEAALEELLAETDSQDDDVIKIDPGDLSEHDVQQILDYIPTVRASLANGATFTEDWDGDRFTPPAPLKIHVGDFLREPVQDWKALLPSYEATVVRVTYGYNGQNVVTSSGTETIETNLASAWLGDIIYAWQWSFVLDSPISSYLGPPELQAPLTEALQQHLQNVSLPTCFESFRGSITIDQGDLPPGPQSLSADWNTSLSLNEGCYHVPKVTWTAPTFEQFNLPDHTLNGLLPEITSSAELWELFRLSANNWQREVVLDWTEFILGQVDYGPFPPEPDPTP